jgi:hypothetical protein
MMPYGITGLERVKAMAGSQQGNGMGTAYCVCELASAVQRRHVGDLPAFGTVGEWQGSGRVVAGLRHGNGMVCESALRQPSPPKRRLGRLLTNTALHPTRFQPTRGPHYGGQSVNVVYTNNPVNYQNDTHCVGLFSVEADDTRSNHSPCFKWQSSSMGTQ